MTYCTFIKGVNNAFIWVPDCLRSSEECSEAPEMFYGHISTWLSISMRVSGPYSLFITSQSVQPFVTAVKSKGGATTFFFFTIANFHLKYSCGQWGSIHKTLTPESVHVINCSYAFSAQQLCSPSQSENISKTHLARGVNPCSATHCTSPPSAFSCLPKHLSLFLALFLALAAVDYYLPRLSMLLFVFVGASLEAITRSGLDGGRLQQSCGKWPSPQYILQQAPVARSPPFQLEHTVVRQMPH